MKVNFMEGGQCMGMKMELMINHAFMMKSP